MVHFDTSEYELSHGKTPRGYGSWAFEFSVDRCVWWAPTGTFTAAKKAARAEAKRRSVEDVKVLP